jgi:ATP-dependent DNA ligase
MAPALPERHKIDGEAVILGFDGISDFNALHSDGMPAIEPAAAGRSDRQVS